VTRTARHKRQTRYAIVFLLVFATACTLALLSAAPATAVDEPVPGLRNCTCHWEPVSTCTKCHQYPVDGQDAGSDGIWSFYPPYNAYMTIGPHGLYTDATSRCDMCHTLHDAPTSFRLLPGSTVTSTCFSCHDGTGGQGVYGAIAARGLSVQGGHSVDTTNVVPGGDPASGGNTSVTFGGAGTTMSCDDCHSPHGSNTVAKFTGERVRIWTGMEAQPPWYSTKLLKQKPTGATTATAEYGSDWCMGCHKGRASGGMVMNHPVESKATRADPYVYGRIPVIKLWNQSDWWGGVPARGSAVVVGTLGYMGMGSPAHNASPIPGDPGPNPAHPASWEAEGWLMTYPRAALQAGHAPICQQCHEDAREVGYLSDDGSTAWIQPQTITGAMADGQISGGSTANPRFQNFPHETENANMLLEAGDDLCLNCHPPSKLP